MTDVASRERARSVEERGITESVLAATGIEKACPRGLWSVRRQRLVRRGAELALWPGEVVGLVWLAGLGVAATLLFSPAVQPAAIHPSEA
jgi:hypothetical protein